MEIKEVSTLVPIYILSEQGKKLHFMDNNGSVFFNSANQLIPLPEEEALEVHKKINFGSKFVKLKKDV